MGLKNRHQTVDAVKMPALYLIVHYHVHPTATKQRWQPASQVAQVKDLPAVEREERESHKICARTTPMNNQELIRILDRDRLLSVVELLSRLLMFPYDDLADLENEIYELPEEILKHCESLTDYRQLKLMQLIINTLVHEAEQSAVGHFQTKLPLKTEAEIPH